MTAKSNSEVSDLSAQIELINELEAFVFLKIGPRFISFIRFDQTLLNPIDETSLKSSREIVYKLHDEGYFKESDEQKNKRLSNDPIIIDSEISYKKADHYYLPKHYHEIIQAIREFHHLAQSEKKDYKKINEARKKIFYIYAFHLDCSNITLIPNKLYKIINSIQNQKKSLYIDKIKEKVYLKLIKKFIRIYKRKQELLWRKLKFSKKQINYIHMLDQLKKMSNQQFNTKTSLNEYKKQLREMLKLHKTRFDILIAYFNDFAFPLVNFRLKKYYKRLEKEQQDLRDKFHILQNTKPWIDSSFSRYQKRQYLKNFKKGGGINSIHSGRSSQEIIEKSDRQKSKYKKKAEALAFGRNEAVDNQTDEAIASTQKQSSPRNPVGNTDRILESHPKLLEKLEKLIQI